MDQISIEDGLSHSLIFDIEQDDTGFLWFATIDGLNRYDGYNFIHFKNDPDDSTSIGENWISSIEFDKSGNLWIGTWGNGLNLLEKGTSKFKRFSHDPNNPNSISHNRIQKILIDSKGKIWASTWGGGLNVFDPESGNFKSYQHNPQNPHGLPENELYALFEDSNNNIWIGTYTTGLCKLDTKSGIIKNFINNTSDIDELRANFITAIFEDKFNTLWIGTFGDGLHKFDKKEETFIDCPKSSNIPAKLITDIYEDKKNNLWIGTDDEGLFKYSSQKESFTNYRNNELSTGLLNDRRIWKILKDRTGILYFGTYSSGFGIYKETNNIFKHLRHDKKDFSGIIDNFVKAIYLDNDSSLWVGTDKGISIFNFRTAEYKHLQHNPSNKNSICHNRVRKIYKDSEGIFWIATWGGGVTLFDPKRNTYKHFQNDKNNPHSISDNYARDIIENGPGQIFIATENGLNVFDRKKNKFSLINHNPDDPNSLSSQQITSLLFENDSLIWIGTQFGLNYYNLKTSKNKRFLYSEYDKSSLSNNRIRDIFIDKNNNVWVATLGGGINRYDKKTGTFVSFTEKDGLPNNICYKILEDKEDNLWISTNKGLSRFNTKTLKFRNYDVHAGVQSNEFNGGAAYYNSESGEMYFGGVNGINYFYPNHLTDNKNIPSIAITKFQVNNEDYLFPTEIDVLNSITLNYTENFLNFEFAALDFTSISKNQYAYKLEGLDEEWISIGSKNYANYTNLAPGKYTFYVKGSNNDGVWNTNGKKLEIEIIPPFWQTWYFRIVAVLLVSIIIATIFFYRISSIKKNKKQLEVLVQSRTNELSISNGLLKEANSTKDKFMSILAHDLKNPFGAIISFSDLLLNEYYHLKDSEKLDMISSISTSAHKTLSLLENLLTWAQNQSNKIVFTPSKLNLKELIDTSIFPYDFFAKSKNITIEICVDEAIIFADKFMLVTTIGNLVNNAIKFSAIGGTISISNEISGNLMRIHINDEGIGIESDEIPNLFKEVKNLNEGTKKEKGIGLGLLLCKEFVEKHGGQILISSTVGKGSTFTIEIPQK